MHASLLRIGGPTLCVILTIGLLLAGKSAITGVESAAVPDMALETPDLSDVPTIGEEPAGSADVPADPGMEAMPFSPDAPTTNDGVTPKVAPEPPAVDTAPLAPPSAAPADPAPSPAPLTEAILRHPVALSAGLIQFDGRTIQLAGIKPQSADRICTSTRGDWPCGTVARTAFRNFIRARAFTCQVPAGDANDTVTADCRVGTDDPALWLARNGWAEVDGNDPDLTAALEAAKATAKGFYRAGSEPIPPSPGPAP